MGVGPVLSCTGWPRTAMQELLYDVDSAVIAGVLLVWMAVAVEAGFRYGVARRAASSDASRAQLNTTQTSIFGILALLLAFTFSLSVQRFDHRSDTVVDEANAIGTAYLRAELLPAAMREEVQ